MSMPRTKNINTLLKKIKGSDVLEFYCMMIFFSEQDNANYFLLISSFSINTVKFQNRQNNLFFTKMYGLFLSKPFFRYATQASQRIGGVFVSSRPAPLLDLRKI